MKKLVSYFSKFEIALWRLSTIFIVISFIIFDRENYLILISSLIGVTSLIFNAKCNHFEQILMIFFSLLYGFISYTFSYYGEMITYLGMTMPMASDIRYVSVIICFIAFFFNDIYGFINWEKIKKRQRE